MANLDQFLTKEPKDLSQFLGKSNQTPSKTSFMQRFSRGQQLLPPQYRVGTAVDAVKRASGVVTKGLPEAYESVKSGIGRLKRGAESFNKEGGIFSNPQASMALLGGAGEIAAAPFIAALQIVKPEIDQISNKIPEDAKIRITETIDKLPPDLKQFASDTLSSLGLLTGGIYKKGLKDLLTRQSAKKSLAVEKKIAPKLTPTQQKIARAEGRVTRPKTNKLREKLFGRKEDIVESSKRVKEAAQTVQREVPNANKLDDIALEKAIRAKSLEKVKPLKAELQKVPLDKKAIPDLKSKWNIQKNKNTENLRSVGIKESTLNKNFEKTIEKMTQQVRDSSGKLRTKNMDDVWDLAKAYDDTVSDTVKNASRISPESLQIQKDVWLTNRSILRDFIKANSKEASEAFSTMHDLLTAAENMAAKGVTTKPTQGLITPKRAAIGAGAIVAGRGIRKLRGGF